MTLVISTFPPLVTYYSRPGSLKGTLNFVIVVVYYWLTLFYM